MADSTQNPTLGTATRAVRRIAARYAAELGCLPDGVLTQVTLQIALQRLLAKGYVDIGARLRVLRQIVFYRLYVLDCEQHAPLATITQGMSDLAEVCLQQACQTTHAQLAAQHGEPMAANQPSRLWTLGMGKLGARELNISSDIDLIYVYEHAGETQPTLAVQTSISNHMFFAEQVKRIQRLLSDVTEHGFVFRVDLALRPYGSEGALAVSLSTLAQYFQRSGREWERFAWLKARAIPTPHAPPDVLPLRTVVRAFVFRRFLDFKVFSALQQLHQLIRQHGDSLLGARDIKVGRGGIREIEFAAQVSQIVRGGRQPELLARPTMGALSRLASAGLMEVTTVQTLREAYIFLRRVEHRIQYLDDAQTHSLPTSPEDLMWIAGRMGFTDTLAFQAALEQHRNKVAAIFSQLLENGVTPKATQVTVEELQRKAAWTVSYLRKHPDAADELKRPDLLTSRFHTGRFLAKTRLQYQALKATGLGDEEAILDLLRRAHHAEVFRILVRDIQGQMSVRDVGDELSSLADSLLQLALLWCWHYIPERLKGGLLAADALDHFAVIAYGKLGGKELGYGSDLDIVFVYDDPSDVAAERYTVWVRKLITWLTAKTSEGDLYEVDTSLRPNGNSGLLVTSIEAYEKYQLQRGSNTAWTWELQAMTRARCVVGASALQARFDAIRARVLTTSHDHKALKAEVIAMRQKLYAAYPVPQGQFDIKHSPGGMMDVEFCVQYLVLAYAREYPALIANLGNIELLRIAQAHHLVPTDVGLRAADAYQVLRDRQHAARLQQLKSRDADQTYQAEQSAILELRRTVLGL